METNWINTADAYFTILFLSCVIGFGITLGHVLAKSFYKLITDVVDKTH